MRTWGAGEAAAFNVRSWIGRTHGSHPGSFLFAVLAILVGLVAGLGAVAFRALIALVHNLGFEGRFSAAYDANVHTAASPLGPFVIAIPVLGALAVTFLIVRFAPEAKGHGVPEVMDAIYYGRSIIRPVVAVVKSLASAVSIGTGGSVGARDPSFRLALRSDRPLDSCCGCR
jgi:CIC family chloride channel protein